MRRPKTYIVNEEEHLENLRKIIIRDFFGQSTEDSEENNAVKLSLNDYVGKYKSDENQVFTELVKENDDDWKEKHKWMEKSKLLML